jgi:hypothetical protein
VTRAGLRLPLIDHLRETAGAATTSAPSAPGVITGSWFSSKERRGEELIAAGLLMLAGHVDLDELDTWVGSGGAARRCRTGTVRIRRVCRPVVRQGHR